MSDDSVGAPHAEAQPIVELEWRRLHPFSPLLRGGLFLIVVAGIIITNLRDRVFEIFFDKEIVDALGPNEGDLIDYLAGRRLLFWALVVIVVVILLIVAVSWLSWRFSTFRITVDAVESKRGVLFRQHRRAPLDRIQSVNLQRSLLARLLGLTEVDVQTGGQGGKVALQYLGHREAKEVREQILLAARVNRQVRAWPGAGAGAGDSRADGAGAGAGAGGSRAGAGAGAGAGAAGAGAADSADSVSIMPAAPGPPGLADPRLNPAPSTDPAPSADHAPKPPETALAVDFAAQAYAASTDTLDNRLRDLIDFDIDPSSREAGTLIQVPVGRLIVSILLSSEMLVVIAVVGLITGTSIWATPIALAALLPLALVMVSVLISQFNKGFNFVLSRAEDGVRIGAGLTATTTETIPFGRVHAIEALQPLGWRPLGWWKVRITTAGYSAAEAGQNKMQNMVLPVGTVDDVLRVFETLLHVNEDGANERRDALRDALVGAGNGYVRPGPKAGVLLWFGTRRAGLRIEAPDEDHASLRVRRGWVTRSLSVMPIIRAQSVQFSRPMVHYWLGLASVQAHTVLGPVRVFMRGIALADAHKIFETLAETVVTVQSRDADRRASGEMESAEGDTNGRI